MCKIWVTLNSTKASILWGGTVERFGLVWVALGKARFRKTFPSTAGWGRGESIGSKKEHGWKIMWQKTRDFGSQMSDLLGFQFRSPGMQPRFSQAPQAIHFFNKYSLTTKVCLGLFQVLGIRQLMSKSCIPWWNLFLVSLNLEVCRSWAHSWDGLTWGISLEQSHETCHHLELEKGKGSSKEARSSG